MSRSRVPVFALLVLLLATPTLADWNPEMSAKWVQFPDLSTMGIDVNASPSPRDYILADDFECTETGLITGIHIWGSWYHDMLPFDVQPDAVMFTLSIHADIPATAGEYSRPGELLWYRTFQPGEFVARIWEEGIQEGWMNPPDYYEFPGDTVCWQYNFDIPLADAFEQLGMPDEPIVYWLDVKAVPEDDMAHFGWKTSLDHWNDDAVWGEGMEPYPGPWQELIYPPGHEMQGQSIDLAFVIAGEDHQDELDWGDAPDAAGALGYPTLMINNGANHLIVPNIFLGLSIDAEADGQQDPNALGDDNDGNDDEDGVVFTSALVPGQPATVDVTASVPGFLHAWVDFDINGDWAGVNERIFGVQPLVAGLNTLTFNVPASAVTGTTFARFRFSTTTVSLTYTGGAPDGEVEDYEVWIDEVQEQIDWGDAPDDPTGGPGYPTYSFNGGANHVIVAGLFLGNLIDAELDGQPDANATGDDLAGVGDEDGVTFTSPLYPGFPATVDIIASAPGIVDAWIDFDVNLSWGEATDYILVSVPVNPGNNTLTFNVPASAPPSTMTFARFRYSSMGGLPFTGPAPDGEVEDYRVMIDDKYVMKWIQHPDLSIMGIDVAACRSFAGDEYLLADDFLCTQTGPLTDFHIWGSWLNDYLPFYEDPTAVKFVLSIHRDIPAGVIEEWSMPGEILWWHEFQPGEFEVDMYADQIEEGFMYPPEDYIFPADWTCWRYKFHVDPHLAFKQEGNEAEPVIYWLDLKAYPLDPEAQFGWKTSLDHWNDDAVWGLGDEPYPGPWFELRYPPNHEMWGQSIDLAFAIMEDVITAVPDQSTPERVGLHQNVPNPFNPRTEIKYDLPADGGRVRLDIFDVMGRRVCTLVDGFVAGGQQTTVWDGLGDDGEAMPTGVYFANLYMDGARKTVKMVLLR